MHSFDLDRAEIAELIGVFVDAQGTVAPEPIVVTGTDNGIFGVTMAPLIEGIF